MLAKPLLATASAVALIGSAAHAQVKPSEALPDLMDFNCGQYLQSARLANPGPKPSADRQALAIAAQDALASAMLWVHGYNSAKVGGPPEPLTRDWMVTMVGKVAKVCREKSSDGRLRVADAVASM